MRALVMDFAKDKQVLDINDQYMFGKSMLVCPVTKPMYSKISVQGKDIYFEIKNPFYIHINGGECRGILSSVAGWLAQCA
jgi:alpha-glucosidase (family GH31 glycosyl hydrolase)